VQRYAELFGDEFAEQHGVKIAGCTVSLNFLSFLFGVESVEELRTEFADELVEEEIEGLVGVANETYPVKKGAKKQLYGENMQRKKGKERKRFPESFTVGCGYLPQLDCFASVQCRTTGFAWAVAVALVAPLTGVDYWLSDDHDSYNGVLPDRVKCLVHRLRQRARRDEREQELQKAGELAELRQYLEDEYEQSYEELIEQLRAAYPAFWDKEVEMFTGPVSMNAIEGGNWRVKYGLRVGYARCRAPRARASFVSLRARV
jgi:hypothetical protein